MITLSGGYTSALSVGEAAKPTHTALGAVPDRVCISSSKVLGWLWVLGNLRPGFALGWLMTLGKLLSLS